MSALDPVQVAALDFAQGKRGVGWFMEQGLGKTLTALTEFSFLYQMGKVDRAIIICPNTFKKGWLDEAEKHGFQLDIHIWLSTKKADAANWLNKHHDKPPVLIINYEAARMPGVLRALQIWSSRGSVYLAIDESIQIKGHKSAQTKAIHKLAPLCSYVRILTGRPQTQGPHDLWGQLRAIGLFSDTNFYSFRGAFCVMGGWENKEVLRARNTEGLARAMEGSVFQAKKKDWLPNLPRKAPTIRDYQMSNEQQRQYNPDGEAVLAGGRIWRHHGRGRHREIRQTGSDPDRIYLRRRAHCSRTGDPRREPPAEAPQADPRGGGRRQMLCRLPASGDPARPGQGACRLRSGVDQRADEARRDGGARRKDLTNDPNCRIILLQCDASKYGAYAALAESARRTSVGL